MQWFKHDKNFRKNAAIQMLERKYGPAGYAYALKFLEVIAEVAGKKKPFNPTLTLDPPYDWRWLAIELGLYECDAQTGQTDLRFPSEDAAVQVIRDFEVVGYASIVEEGEWSTRKYEQGKPVVVTEKRPYVITVAGMKQWIEWHDQKNRNRKPDAEGDAAKPKVRFSGIGTPE